MSRFRTHLLWALIAAAAALPLRGQEFDPLKSDLAYDPRALAAAADTRGYDVQHYSFNWKFDTASRSVAGRARVRARSTIPSLTVMRLDLANTMSVGQVIHNLLPAAFSHAGGSLDITLDRSYSLGQEFEVEVEYGGTPAQNLTFDSHGGQPVIYSLDEPVGARQWFPCRDIPEDKATADITITVPGDMTAVSNGLLTETVLNADGTRSTTWEETYPISTYLISVAATNYSLLEETYASASGTMPVVHYVYPELLDLAREDFNRTVSMIAFFSRVFGEYPFLREKYGHALIPGGTAMEHQTCTSYPSRCVLGTHQYDWLIAHELAHSWWGDWVTCADWRDIWLNEGFATYSDALWHEDVGGREGLKARMRQFRETYLTHAQPDHPIYDPPEGHLFCRVEYQKAAWVLHMLRFVAGEEAFWSILNEYRRRFGGGSAATEDFIRVAEEVSGRDLGWFFSQWIYGAGLPSYEFGWGRLTGGRMVRVAVNQVQTEYPLFDMPVDIDLVFADGTTRRESVRVGQARQTFDFSVDREVSNVLFDPDDWILCRLLPLIKKGSGGR
jgi:aminopeptidase N